MNNYEIDKVIKMETMPKIFYQLEQIGKDLEIKLNDISNMPCNEDTKQNVKKTRAEINKTLEIFETKRKSIKQQCLNEYNQFEEKYNLEVKSKLENASETLKNKISEIEQEQIKQKKEELFDFAMEYIVANDIQDYVTFDDIGLNITLSASMKSLKEQIIAFCEKVKQDIALIKMEEYRDEILYEYKKNHGNFVQCKTMVLDRHRELNELAKKKVEEETLKEEQQKVVEKVEEVLTTPKEVIENDEIISVTFTINDTKENIVKVREFMKKEGIKYE